MFTDLAVKYGAVYRYQIKSVFYLSTLASTVSADADTQTYYTFLIGSRGSPYIDVTCKEVIPPAPPSSIDFHLSMEQKMLMFWEMPYNKQIDIKRFQIFRRESLEDPYTIIYEIDFDNSEIQTERVEHIPEYCKFKNTFAQCDFTDYDFEFDKTYYYAICSVDAHDLSSPYSDQYKVFYNRIDGKMEVELIAFSGAPKAYPNFTLKQTLIVDCIKDSGHDTMKIYFDPETLLLQGVEQQIPDVSPEQIGRLYEEYLETNEEYPMYKLQLINLDWQQDHKVDIYLKRTSDLATNIADNLPGE